MTVPAIHLVYKTHLDIGFTDHAERVRQQYHNQFIPQAIATGEHFFAEDSEHPKFIWTTGAWLIWDHLNSQDAGRVSRLERAIERGLIAWHALPFTTHTELMLPSLFRAGLSYAQELDRRFGRTTTAAKMTDVPGHTLGMVPILAEAGIRFLHLGVNTASPVPDVPPIFRWRAPDGSEIVVMYQNSYGATDFPAGPDIGLSFAHTSDNIGPQSVAQTVDVLRRMRHENPGANIMASTLDAFGEAIWARRDGFPVVDREIGDSWIHGAGTDPNKLARFRALQRLHAGWEAEPTPARLGFGRRLALVAEHTWGVDIKTYLRDDAAWDRADFERARATDYRFHYTEQSWAEQRAYIDAAVNELNDDDRAAARAATRVLDVPPAEEPQAGTDLRAGGWTAELSPETGDVVSLLAPGGQQLIGVDGPLFSYRHESYDSAALQQHLDTYLQHREEWAILDHDKPGLASARTARTAAFAPRHIGVAAGHAGVAMMPDDANLLLGAPRAVEIAIRAIDDHRLEISLTLRGKPANRMPEAGFFSFTPAGKGDWSLEKLGLWHPGPAIVRRGGGQLQAATAVRHAASDRTLTLELLDAALVAPSGAPFLPFQPDVPDYAQGIRVNLYNNKWGTNFPMWWEGEVLFRFVLTIS